MAKFKKSTVEVLETIKGITSKTSYESFVYGDYSYRVEEWDNGKGGTVFKYTVTHNLSGMFVKRKIPYKQMARKLCEALQDTCAVRWGGYGTPPEEFLKAVSLITFRF